MSNRLPTFGSGPRDGDLTIAFRCVLVAAQVATILITWRLWQTRTSPPLLPALPLAQFDMGPLLLVSLAVVLVRPRLGIAFHWLCLLAAMLLDQTRMQPECISLAILMLGTLSSESAKLVARAHLVALWFFAGFHKLVCGGYYMHTVPQLFSPFVGDAESLRLLSDVLRGGLAAFELSLGILALIPRSRKLCALLACALHTGILLQLTLRMYWNSAVWPWNVALALAGFAMLWSWQTAPLADWQASPGLVRVAILAILVSPFGFYLAWVDPYLSHCLYSNNTPRAVIVTADNRRTPIDTFPSLNAPFPPAHRLFDAYFTQVGKQGDKLVIEDPRWLASFCGFTSPVTTRTHE